MFKKHIVIFIVLIVFSGCTASTVSSTNESSRQPSLRNNVTSDYEDDYDNDCVHEAYIYYVDRNYGYGENACGDEVEIVIYKWYDSKSGYGEDQSGRGDLEFYLD